MSDETDAGKQFVSELLDKSLRWSLKGQKWWSLADHGSTVCVVVFSAIVAVLSQIDAGKTVPFFTLQVTTLTTILSLCVTIISTVQLKLGFERKWIANRLTHSALNQLLIDEETGAKVQDVKEKLKSILDTHDKAITAQLGVNLTPPPS